MRSDVRTARRSECGWGNAQRRGSVTGRQPDRERKLMVIEILDNILYSGYCAITALGSNIYELI